MDAAERQALLKTLQNRFEKNQPRHPGIAWADVQAKLESSPHALPVLQRMEATGGEPDLVAHDPQTNRYTFVDCSPETPAGRRSCCYDAPARTSRKEHAPKTSALELAAEIGAELLTEQQYRNLQKLGAFDLKTSSWIQTPSSIRALGGALFCDRRYEQVFLYHNGAQSYYAARAFRTSLQA